MSYRDIPDTELAEDKFLAASTLRDLRDNIPALAEGAPGAPRIQTDALANGAVNNSKLASGAVSANNVAWVSTVGSRSIGGHESWVIPAGLYLFFRGDSGIEMQVRDSGVWYTLGPAYSVGTVFSDGANMRVRNTIEITLAIYYRKLA